MAKKITLNIEARTELKKGVDELANAVKVTMGPKGRNVVIDKGPADPHVTKDGVSVAKEVYLQDKTHNMGATMVKNVAMKTGDDAGDGTSASCVLTQEIVDLGIKAIDAGANPMDIRRGIDAAVKAVVGHIHENAIHIGSTGKEILQIATVSANNDPIIGEHIAQAVNKSGKQGIIHIDESRTATTRVELIEGFQIESGFIVPDFINNFSKARVDLTEPLILITDEEIKSSKDIAKLLEGVVGNGKQLLIVAKNVADEALITLIQNRHFGFAAVTAPYYGDNMTQTLEDIAALTGGTLISASKNKKLSEATLNDLGTCGSVEITKSKCLIVEGKGNEDRINERTELIKQNIEESDEELEREIYKARLANLTSSIAMVYVGGNSSVEVKEKMDLYDDARCATKAALAEGIVPGGGIALLRAIESLAVVSSENEDQLKGIDIIRSAIKRPFFQILKNAGENPEERLELLNEHYNHGFNALTGKFVDMIEDGIVDPAKVARVALENAASIAGVFLTTEAVLVNVENKK